MSFVSEVYVQFVRGMLAASTNENCELRMLAQMRPMDLVQLAERKWPGLCEVPSDFVTKTVDHVDESFDCFEFVDSADFVDSAESTTSEKFSRRPRTRCRLSLSSILELRALCISRQRALRISGPTTVPDPAPSSVPYTTVNPPVFPCMPMGLVQIPMPDPGTPGAPSFDGKDVTQVIKRFERMCKRRGMVDQAMLCDFFLDYCEEDIKWWVKANHAWLGNDWVGFSRDIREEFKEQDSEYLLYSRSSLLDLVRLPRSTDGEIWRYIWKFGAIANVLVRDGMMLEWESCEWLLAGLPEWLSRRVIMDEDISFEESSMRGMSRPIRLGWVTTAVTETLRAQRNHEKTMTALSQTALQLGCVSSDVSEERSPEAFDLEKAFDSLGKRFQAMTLEVNALKNTSGTMPSYQQTPQGARHTMSRRPAYPNQASRESRSCYYCEMASYALADPKTMGQGSGEISTDPTRNLSPLN
ncbi:hypothetical protein N7535_006274 [Penicillium sp. DV-2018c]|nr:hypothetical protein N7461_007643 [Penicillium sp. DV-2018c]KAJ5566968.1 hypothetical protein N7535_006274 [Penicillium sp. DV-2018c]